MIPGLSPQDIGLPAKFKSWRPGQLLAIDRSISSQKRFVAHSLPTGEGKSIAAVAIGLLTSKRICYLTSSKGLQQQLLSDFESIGMVDMRGRNNYPCHHDSCKTCDEGVHFRCDCDGYEPARNRMLESSLVVSNYKYFMLSHLYGRGMGEFDILIIDEAHDVPDEVCEAMAVEISFGEAQKIGIRMPDESQPISSWWDWANQVGSKAISMMAELDAAAKSDKAESGRVHPSTARDQKFWTTISNKCVSILKSEGDNEWVVDRTNGGYRLEPVWAHQYAQQILFMSIPKIILLSATMVQKTLDLLGITKDESNYYEYTSSFPAKRSPVYLWGAAKIDQRTVPEHIAVWLSRIDNIIRYRQDRNGIIHTVSYDRSRFITDHSEFSSSMITPSKGSETADSIELFKNSPPPSILVSPAITTGYDFPFSQCQYNLIIKVPFIPSTSKLIKARQDKDPEYSPYITAQTIVQSHGRAMRAETDLCETFILDSHINWFIRQYRHLFPFWFHRLTSYPKGLPPPPPALPWSAPERSELSTINPSPTPSSGSGKVIEFPSHSIPRDINKQRTL